MNHATRQKSTTHFQCLRNAFNTDTGSAASSREPAHLTQALAVSVFSAPHKAQDFISTEDTIDPVRIEASCPALVTPFRQLRQ